MAREHERRTSPDRHKALLLIGPLAVTGVIAVVLSGSHLGVHRAAGAQASLVADHLAGAGPPADRLTRETITVRVRLSAALQPMMREQVLSMTLPRDASVGTLLNRLSDAYPVLAAMGPSVVVVVSDRIEPPDRVLANGEIVDLVSQMAGG
jgi:molybdopterin converting factor small subunit